MLSAAPSGDASLFSRAHLRTIALLGGGKLAQMVAALVTLRVMTALLGPAEVTTVSQLSSIAGLAYGVFFYPVITYFIRHKQEWQDNGILYGHLLKYVRYTLILACVYGVIVAVLQIFHPLVTGVSVAASGLIVALLTATLAFSAMGTGGLNVTHHRRLYVAFNNLGVWSTALLGAALFLLVSPIAISWSVGAGLGQTLASLSFLFLLGFAMRHTAAVKEALPLRRIAQFASTQAIAFALWWLMSQSYRFTLGGLNFIETVGLIAASQMITSQLVQAFAAVMGDFFMPRIMSREGASPASLEKFASAMLPASILFGGVLACIGPLLVQLLLDPKFHQVAYFISVTAVIDTFWAVYNVSYMTCNARLDMRPTIWATLGGALLCLALVPLLTQYLPPLPATLTAMLLGYGCMAATSLYTMGRIMRLPWRRSLLAIALSLPVAAIAVPAYNGGLFLCLAALAGSGLCLLGGQLLLAKQWLRRRAA